MKKYYLFVSLLLISISSFSQIKKITPLTDITVIENGDTLKNPFSGGIGAPEFSIMDLNNDGIKDMVIFDKDGSRISCFLNGGTPGKIDYKYAPEYASKFPAGLYDWALLRDYNGDGKEDIFTQSRFGIRIFKNTSTGNDISFELAANDLEANFDGVMSNILVNAYDIPEIIDIDSDGDLDMFVFRATDVPNGGDQIYYFKNYAIELTGSADTLSKYILEKKCWGRFLEDYSSCTAHLQSSLGDCGTGTIKRNTDQLEETGLDKSNDGRHAGSSILIFDSNGDGNYDVLVGDVSCNNMYLLTNTNSNAEAIMTSVNYNYPTVDPIDVFVFPSAFFVDVNNDGKRDLITATNMYRGVENYNTNWLYLNTGTDAAPNFTLTTKSFLQEEMIDVRQNATPHFFDYNQDGKMDLAIANSGSWLKDALAPPTIDSATVTVYKNIGTNDAPVYELLTRDYSNISQYNFINLSMTTGDVDEDGDPDLMLGEDDGMLYYFNNNAGPGAPANFVLHTPFYQNIDIGRYSLPNLVDVNNDQKLDLLLGGRAVRDTINLYLDTATTNPLPEFKLTNKFVGGIKQIIPSSTGASLYLNQNYDGEGTNSLFVTKGSIIYFYDSIPGNLSGVFKKTDSIYLNIGNAIRITMQDLNGDGKKELIAGTSAGGLTAYEIEYMVDSTVGIGHSKAAERLFSVYPNPSNQKLTIVSKDKESDISKVELYDMLGRMVFMKDEVNNINITIPTGSLQNGNYIVRIYSNDSVATQLVMIQH